MLKDIINLIKAFLSQRKRVSQEGNHDYRSFILTHIYVLVHEDGTNIIDSGRIYEATKEISDYQSSVYNLHLGAMNDHQIVIDDSNARMNENGELIYYTSPIVILVSDGCAPNEKQI